LKRKVTTPTRTPTIHERQIPTATIDGVEINDGTMMVVEGEVGTFKFKYVDATDGSITCVGGQTGYGMWRSFKPERCHLVGWIRPRETDGDEPVTHTRSQRYAAFVNWARAHDGEQFTTEQLVEQSGFSYQTTLKFIDSHPNFNKIKKGLYECRNDLLRRNEKKN
jgi:hypothetical protein